MKWVASSLNRKEPIEKAGVFELKGNDLYIRIHHYRGCDATWFLSCAPLGIDKIELGEISFDEAVEKSKKIVRQRIDELQNLANRFISDGTENERARY